MTFNRWRKEGAKDAGPVELRDFCEHLRTAEARGADTLLTAISKAGRSRDWRAAAWILERRYPQDWSLRNEVEIRQNLEADSFREVISEEEITSIMSKIWANDGTFEKLGYVKADKAANGIEKNETVANSNVPGAKTDRPQLRM